MPLCDWLSIPFFPTPAADKPSIKQLYYHCSKILECSLIMQWFTAQTQLYLFVVNLWWTTAWCDTRCCIPLLLIISLLLLLDTKSEGLHLPLNVCCWPSSSLLSGWAVNDFWCDNWALSGSIRLSLLSLICSHCPTRGFRKVTVVSSAPWQETGGESVLHICLCLRSSSSQALWLMGTVIFLLSESSEYMKI